ERIHRRVDGGGHAAQVPEDGACRNEEVLIGRILQKTGGVAHPIRGVRARRGVVDDRVPGTTAQGAQVRGGAVPDELLDAVEHAGRAPATVEGGDLVTPLQ